MRDDVAEDAGARGVDEFELRHPQDHDRDALHPGHGLEDAVGGGEEQRTVEADDRDPLVARDASLRRVASRRTPVARDRLRSAKTPAHTTPIATATIRSNDTVITAVRMNATASERVDRSTERMVARCTIRTAVTMSTPASAASGMRADRPRGDEDDEEQDAAWKSAAIRVRPPERTFTAVRAIAPVAGIPPNRPDADRGETLPDELAVGIVGAGVGEGRGDPRREQRLDRRERGHREGRQRGGRRASRGR